MKVRIFGLMFLWLLSVYAHSDEDYKEGWHYKHGNHKEDYDGSIFDDRDIEDRLSRPDHEMASKSLYKKTSGDQFVSNQTTQGMILSIMLLFNKDSSTRGFMIDSVLKENIKTLNIKIKELADSCTKEKDETNGEFTRRGIVVRDLKGIDLVNRALHRKGIKHGPEKAPWYNSVHDVTFYKYKYIYPRPATDKNGRSSFNICKYSDTYKYYDDSVTPDQFCESVSELKSCLLSFQSSGKAPKAGLTDDEMSDLFYDFNDIEDIENLMRR